MTFFNRLMLTTFSHADVSRLDYPSGRDTIEHLLELPLERREVSFLVSDDFSSMNLSQVGSVFQA